MTNRMKYIVLGIALLLFNVSLLQIYYGWKVYLQETEKLQKEINTALQKTVAKVEKERILEIKKQFEKDIHDPTLTKLELRKVEGVPQIYVIDPLTDLAYVSTPYRNWSDSITAIQNLENQIIARTYELLQEGSIMFWTERLGERLKAYWDTTFSDSIALEQELKFQLINANIDRNFLIVYQDSIRKIQFDNDQMISELFPITLHKTSQVGVAIKNPHYEILSRTGSVLALTLAMLLLIAISFWVLIRLLNKQKKLSKLKDDFIDNITHELLTPITTLTLTLDSVGKETLSNKYFKIAQQQAQRIADIVNHILKVSFNDTDTSGVKMGEVSLEDVLEEVITFYKITVKKPLQIVFETSLKHVVWSDTKHLTNIFHNVISNAIKYSGEKGTLIKLSIHESEKHVSVKVTDNGWGVPNSERMYIFEKFHRVNRNDTHDVKGLGIGLYYTKEILKQMNGDIQLLESSSSGSTFEVKLLKFTNQ